MFIRESWRRWCRNLVQTRGTSRRRACQRPTVWKAADVLEERTLLTTLHVTTLDDSGSGSLRDQIAASTTGDTIVFDLPGTVTLTSGELEIDHSLTIEGQGASQTTIDAGGNSRVFLIDSSAGNVALNSMTITGGKTVLDHDKGGAVSFHSSGTLTLTDSIVTGNSTTGLDADGAGIYSDDGAVVLLGSTVSNNSTTGLIAQGGGIFTNSGSVSLTDSAVSGNSTAGGESLGGGIYDAHGAITLTSSSVTGNSTTGAAAEGGGIYCYDGSVTLLESTVAGNSTLAASGRGGGIYVASAPVTLTGSTISGNSTTAANSNGGGIYSWSGTVSVDQSTISGNFTLGASSTGGGIHSRYATIDVTDSTVTGNTTSGLNANGGGIFSWFGNVTLNSSTLSGNTALGNGAHGGGAEAYAGSMTFENSIAAGNQAYIFAYAPDVLFRNNNGTGTFTATNSLFGINTGTPLLPAPVGSPDQDGNLVGTEAQPIDPKLNPLANNGGPTQTMSLQATSPALGAGGTTLLTTDQRGAPFARVVGGQLDMGAYEVQSLSLVVTTADDELDATYDPNNLSLREAIELANANPGLDTITFAPALSGVAIDLTLGQLTITDTVDIEGLGATNTVIDAQQLSRVFDVSSTAGDVTLAGLRITGGKTTAVGAVGAGIRFLSSGTLTLVDSLVTENGTTGSNAYGGGIYSDQGDVVLQGSTVSDNYTTGYESPGGGISTHSGDITLTDSAVSGNFTTGLFGSGGGIRSYSGAISLTDSTVTGNSTAGDTSGGGGISSYTGAVELMRSLVSGNSTTGLTSVGGGISSSRPLTVISSTISGNFTTGASSQGGGIFAGTYLVTLDDSTVSGNYTSNSVSDGGGIYVAGGNLTATNSTIADNATHGDSADGGGIRMSSGTVTLTSSTVSGNQSLGSGTEGGGISSLSGSMSFLNSIVAGNTAVASAPDVDFGGTGTFTANHTLFGVNDGTPLAPAPVGHPDVDGNLVGTAVNPIDPMLAALANNGGPTQTMALQPGSPALNAGGTTALQFDQRGVPFSRVVGGQLDMGAFEKQQLTLVVTTANDELDSDYDPSDLSLREALQLANENPGLDTITFAPALSGVPINLTLGELTISDTVEIDGLGQDDTTIDAQQDSRVFVITSTAGDVFLTGVTITGGQTTAADDSGAGILSQSSGVLTLTDSTVSGNSATGTGSSGGGIYASAGSIMLDGTTVEHNSAAYYGGGIWSMGAVTLTASSVDDNTAGAGGGGILVNSGNVTLEDASSVSGNEATNGLGGGISVATGSVFVTGASHVDTNTAHNVGGILVGNVANPVVDDAVRVEGESTVNGNSSTGGNPPTADDFGGGGIATLTFGNVFISDSQVSNNHTVGMYSGGIVVALGSVTVTDGSQINGNTNNGPGGGIAANFGGTITVTGGSQVNGNTGAALGGGIINFAGPLGGIVVSGGSQVINNILTNGETIGQAVDVFLDLLQPTSAPSDFANAVGGAGGSAMLSAISQTLTIATPLSVQLQNAADLLSDADHSIGGGGLATLIAPITISEGSQVSGNSTQTVTGGITPLLIEGGGVFTIDAQVTATDSTIADNTAANNGGGIHDLKGNVTVQNSTISGNEAGDLGGAIYSSGGDLSITNSTLADNSATGAISKAGAIFANGGSLTLVSSTVSGNSAPGTNGFLGGIFLAEADGTITNSIVAGNTSTTGPATDLVFANSGSHTLTVHNSLIGNNAGTPLAPAPVGHPDANGNLVGTAVNPIDPMLADLANNGGLTKTMALEAGSPALGGGGTTALLFDQRGTPFQRVVAGQLDMGAFQSQIADTTPITTIDATEGGAFCNVVLMTFHSTDPAAVVGDFVAIVDWGATVTDPSVAVRFVSSDLNGSDWEVVGMATYPIGSSDDSPFTLTVTVTARDASVATTNNTTVDVTAAQSPARQLNRQTGLAGFYYDGTKLASVMQNGAFLTLVDGDGNTSDGTISDGTVIDAPGFSLTALFDQDAGTITFSDSSVWSKVRQIDGQWITGSGTVAGIRQVGTELTLTGGTGSHSAGSFTSATTLVASDWGNITGTLSSDGLEIDWSNGTVWNLIPDFQGNWAGTGGPTRIEQQGANLLFVNRTGGTSVGSMINATQVMTGVNWGSVIGDIVGNSIQFANGSTWTIPQESPVDPDLGGLWQNGSTQNTRVLQAFETLTFVNASGGTSVGQFVTPTEVFAIDWNQHGQIVGNQIVWQNSTTWTRMPYIDGAYLNHNNNETGINQLETSLTFTDQFGVVTHGTLVDPTHIVETDGSQRTATISGGVITWSNGPIWTALPELSGNWQMSPGCDPTYVESAGRSLLFIDESGHVLTGNFTTPTTAQLTRQDLPSPPIVSVTIPDDHTIDFGGGTEWTKFPATVLDDVFADPNFWPFV